MKGDPKVIEALNDILCGELTAINQYFLHARMCKNWGFDRLADFIYKESIEEMKHAQDLMDRVLFLDGFPNLQKLGKLNIGETVVEQLRSDLALEEEARSKLKTSIQTCYDAVDHGSRELLESILKDEEHHIDWIETQLSLVKELGEQGYLTQQMHSS